MQLLPGTAAQLAKAMKLRYAGARDLFDPDINITLGTRYLGNMALHYDGSPWLASAAYNAGVDPVGRWIDARDALEPDFFIETIPYKETREYVARVLAFSVIYDWRMHGTVLTAVVSACRASGSAYTLPGADAPRKPVVCPAPAKAIRRPTHRRRPEQAASKRLPRRDRESTHNRAHENLSRRRRRARSPARHCRYAIATTSSSAHAGGFAAPRLQAGRQGFPGVPASANPRGIRAGAHRTQDRPRLSRFRLRHRPRA